MLSTSAFGSADKTYLDLDYYEYHKNLLQFIIIYLLLFTVSHNIKHRLHVHVLEFGREAENNFISVMFA